MKRDAYGFSLIEMMIALVVLAIMLALAAPSYTIWISNTKIRTAAEALQNGLQLARAEAVRRNAVIRFQLTSNLGDDCALSTTVGNWVVSIDDPAGNCAGAVLNDGFPINDDVNNPAPRIIQRRAAAEGSSAVVLDAGQAAIIFNGLGRLTPIPATNPVRIEVSNPLGGATCVAASGTIRCLRVTVTVGGQIRICDPALPQNNLGTDPQRCTDET